MGTIYFILKNSVLTFVLVSLLQIKLGTETLENHLMKTIRKTIAPKFLGLKPDSEEIGLSKSDIEKFKKFIKDSSIAKKAKEGTKTILNNKLKEHIKKKFNGKED